MKTDIWMPLYINEILSETIHLSAEETGAYLLLLMNYWKRGSIGSDLDRICKFSRISSSITQALLEEFFILTQEGWKHERLDEELRLARENRKKKEERSKRAAEARWGKKDASGNAKGKLKQSSSNTKGELEQCPSPSPTPIIKKKEKNIKKKTEKSETEPVTLEKVEAYAQEIGSGVPCEYFFNYYQARGWKWKNTAIVDWTAVFNTWDLRLRNGKDQETESATKPAADHMGVDEDVPEEEIQNLLKSGGAKACHA